MFGKKHCKRCDEKIGGKFKFCPGCGYPTKNVKEEDWGMLGKNDFISPMDEVNLPAGFNIIFNSLMKNLNKQFKNLENEAEKNTRGNFQDPTLFKKGISISISTSGDKPPKIRMCSLGNMPEIKEKKISKNVKKIPKSEFSEKKLRKLSMLPKQEPETDIRRLSNKVIYEIKMPDVESIKDVSIIQLENSIEIKALAKEKVYFKSIPISLPITNYNLAKGKLVLELKVEE